MGHHLFVRGGAVLAMNDSALELVRHFLVKGAESAGLEDVSRAVQKWEWIGPGVWLNVDTSVFSREPNVFEAAIRAASSLGDQVPLEYLEEHLREFGTTWLRAQDVEGILIDVRRLQGHVVGA